MIKKLLASMLVAAIAPLAFVSTARAADKTIVETAAANPDFSTLVKAVKAAGLADTLSGPGPFTVFAPTNEAFAKIPADKLNAVLADKELLTKILMAHVVKDKAVMASDVMAMDGKEVNGFKIKVDDGKVCLMNDKCKAMVTKTDIKCSNGIIHVIDTVLMPDSK